MNVKQAINKNLTFILAATCILLLLPLIGAVVGYSSLVNTRESQIEILETRIDQKEKEIFTLNNRISGLETYVSVKETEIDHLNNMVKELNEEMAERDSLIGQLNSSLMNMNSELSNKQAPRIINVGLGAADNSGTHQPNLYVSGYVCNAGGTTAYNVKLHVTAYQGSVLAIDQYIFVDYAIESADSRYIEERINYSGGPLTYGSWRMSPEWTNTP